MNSFQKLYLKLAKEQLQKNFENDRNAYAHAKDMFNLKRIVGV